MRYGVVVAADLTQQWLLSWWWEHYRRHNDYPVTFVDLGMSEDKRLWCQERGQVISLRVAPLFVKEKHEVDPAHIPAWEGVLGEVMWESRGAWFRKPLACLKSEYEYALWLDLDCQVMGSLKGLFQECASGPGVALVKEGYEGQYNAGVIVFERKSSLIAKWAELCQLASDRFSGDETVLGYLIEQEPEMVRELSPLYNWSRMKQEPEDTVILHWHGPQGKRCIEHQIFKGQWR